MILSLKVAMFQMILDEETKRGIFQGLPAQKTVRKILDILCKSGKIKIIRKTVCNKALNKSRDLEFVCIPTVTESESFFRVLARFNFSKIFIKIFGYFRSLYDSSCCAKYSQFSVYRVCQSAVGNNIGTNQVSAQAGEI